MSDSRAFHVGNVAIFPPLTAAPLFGAGVNDRYMGARLTEGGGDPTLRSPVDGAAAGARHVPLGLGIRCKDERGINRDIAKSRHPYRHAVSDSGGAFRIYSPPLGSGAQSWVMPPGGGVRIHGPKEAESGLADLNDD